uniref:Uncharacterized protein n=1 Tax=uncultured marine virus TaxID=186617 RepID=A0A0F7L4Y2_9VIRU|nr:hypothetical protein [uncultured marine virus]
MNIILITRLYAITIWLTGVMHTLWLNRVKSSLNVKYHPILKVSFTAGNQ